ncbi:MAG: hypothetical protein AB8B79_15600 [Granulosicoccus sp.]
MTVSEVKHDIAFLHTAEVHLPTFQGLVDKIDATLRVRHEVDESLLEDAIAGGVSPELTKRVNAAMQQASNSGAKIVVCTCSSIGGMAEGTILSDAATSMRVDRPMADQAVENHQRILVVAALESTLEPTRVLLEQSSAMAKKNPDISYQLIEGAWPFFLAGNLEQFYQRIADFIEVEQHNYDCVILAQASMAPVATRIVTERCQLLASPGLGVSAAIDHLSTRS